MLICAAKCMNHAFSLRSKSILHTAQPLSMLSKVIGATVMVATDCIATATQVILSYLPGGTDVHNHLIQGSFGPQESAPKLDLDKFSHICRTQGRDKQTDHGTPSVATDHIYAMHATWPDKNNHYQTWTC